MAQRALTAEEIDRLLREQRLVRVAFAARGQLYVLPLGYIWRDGALHLMTTAGRKSEMAAASGRVAFQLDDSAEKGMLAWSSVTGEGDWEIVADRAEQKTVGAALIDRFPELREWAARETSAKDSAGELLFARIKPVWMSGRAFVRE